MKCEVIKCTVDHLPFLWSALVLDTHTGCSVDTDVKASKDFLKGKTLGQLFICFLTNELEYTNKTDKILWKSKGALPTETPEDYEYGVWDFFSPP